MTGRLEIRAAWVSDLERGAGGGAQVTPDGSALAGVEEYAEDS